MRYTYGELCVGLKGGLKVVKCSRKSKNQPWFSANLYSHFAPDAFMQTK